jgi:endonuclease YncB( thermonuclease family)
VPEQYVALSNFKYGVSDGTVIEVRRGDEVPSEMTEDQLRELRIAGTAAPKSVHDALTAAERATEKARAEQEKAEAELNTATYKLQTSEREIYVLASGEVEPEPEPEAKAVVKPSGPSATPPKAPDKK